VLWDIRTRMKLALHLVDLIPDVQLTPALTAVVTMRTVLLCLLMGLSNCGLAPRQTGGDVLVIGDSVMAWNRSGAGDIGSVIEAELGREVVNRAALGAQIRASGLGTLGGLSIPDQLSGGPWNWVVMNGGANDLGVSCGGIRCDAEIDLLISKDGTTGAIPDLMTKARQQQAKVLWVGYYQAPNSMSFKGCRPGLVELERRIADFAGTQDGIFFIDSEDVFETTNLGLLAADRTHPSAAGSAVIGRFIAREIARRSQP
jgi:lysophospholipase L1-like esterase